MDGEKDRTMRKLALISLIGLPLLLHAEHMFELGLHAGGTAWKTQPVYVNTQMGLHAGLNLYYDYFSQDILGFRTGLTLDLHQSGLRKTDFEDSYSTIDMDDQPMVIDYRINRLTEQYTTYSLGIPLQLALAYKRFALFAGAKVFFPLHANWVQTAQNAQLSVYFPTYDNRVYESVPLAASRDFSMQNAGTLDLPKVQWWLSFELNYTLPITTWNNSFRSYIMIGAYFDYSLSPVRAEQSDAISLIMLTEPCDGFPLQRVLTPVLNANRQNNRLIPSFAPFDFGIKISYALSPYNPHPHSTRHCNCL